MNHIIKSKVLIVLLVTGLTAYSQVVTSEIEVIPNSSTIIKGDLEVQGKLEILSSVSLNKSYHGKAYVRRDTPNTNNYAINLADLFPDIDFDDRGKLWVSVQIVAEKSGGAYRQGGFEQSFLRNHHKGWSSSGPYAITSWDGWNYPYNLRGDGDILNVEIGGSNVNFAMTIEVTKL